VSARHLAVKCADQHGQNLCLITIIKGFKQTRDCFNLRSSNTVVRLMFTYRCHLKYHDSGSSSTLIQTVSIAVLFENDSGSFPVTWAAVSARWAPFRIRGSQIQHHENGGRASRPVGANDKPPDHSMLYPSVHVGEPEILLQRGLCEVQRPILSFCIVYVGHFLGFV
jgi:hypothetical protein